MQTNVNFIESNALKNVLDFVSNCQFAGDLIEKLEVEPSFLLSVTERPEYMEKVGTKLANLICKIDPKDLSCCTVKESVKKVETALRNRSLLHFEDCNIALQCINDGETIVNAHKSILCLESPHFYQLRSGKDLTQPVINLDTNSIAKEVYQMVVQYLYLSDDQRNSFVSSVDKSLLPEILKLAAYWQLDELSQKCEEELIQHLSVFNIETEDELSNLIHIAEGHSAPKLALLLKFIGRVANGKYNSAVEGMNTPEQASQLASKCTPEEIAVFSTLKTEFGKACQLPEGAFGKKAWEETFPVTIVEVPPLPANIHTILEQEDPCEPGKKLKETCMLFLRPEKVILKEEGDKELYLSFDGVEELAKKATNYQRRARCFTHEDLYQIRQNPAAKSGWVLMRRELIPNTRNTSFNQQKQLLKGCFEVPKLMDAIFLNIITFAKEGKYLYGCKPLTFTHCQEKYYDYQTLVGGFAPSRLLIGGFAAPGLWVYYSGSYDDAYGLSGSWKF